VTLTFHPPTCREGAAHETGFVVWDPVGFADLGSPATLAWFRHAELKHGAPHRGHSRSKHRLRRTSLCSP